MKKEVKTDKYLRFLPNFKEEKTQAYTTLIFTFLALSLFGLFAISPTISTIAELKKELSDNEFIDKRLNEKIKNLSSLQNEYSVLKEDLILADYAIPKSPNPALLASQLQSLAKEANFKIDRLQIFEVELTKQNEDNLKNFFSYTFSLGGEGTEEEISNFISYLLNFERIVNFDSAIMSKEKNENSKLDIRGKVYFKQ